MTSVLGEKRDGRHGGDSLGPALRALRAGRPVAVAGSAGPGVLDVLLPAGAADTAAVAWLVRHTSGLICAAMPGDRAAALRIPAMMPGDGVAGVSVDATTGVSTGISAADRSRTLGLLVAPGTVPADLVRPGHVLPLLARPGAPVGPFDRAGAAAALLRLAGCEPVGALAELLGPDGALGRPDDAAVLGLPLVEASDIGLRGGAIQG